MHMSQETTYLNAVEHVYALALNSERWSVSLDSMAELFGAVGVSFEIFEKATHKPIEIKLGSNLSLVSTEEYMDYYGRISPRVSYNIGQPTGFISCDHMILSETEMDRDEFYADCITPLGLRYFAAAQVHCSASHQAVFAAQRSPKQGHIGEAEIKTLKRLLPHLQQAMDLRFRLMATQMDNQQALDGLERLDEGCLTIDKNGKVRFANSKAIEIAAQCDGITIANDRLSFADRTTNQSYDRALHGLTPEDGLIRTIRDFSAYRPSGKRPYLIALRSLPKTNEFTPYAEPAVATVFIRDPNAYAKLNARLLKQSYNLTEAEIELATALDRGLSLRDISEERNVSITTVRSQLYALMAKLDVRRQTDLVRLLAQYRQPFT